MHKSKIWILFGIGIGILLLSILVVTINKNYETENVEKGTIQAGVYTNKLFGISFTAPEDFDFVSEKQTNKLEKSQNADSEKGSALKNRINIDMVAENDRTGETVSVMITNLGELGATQNQEEVIDGFMKNLNKNTEENSDILYQGNAKLGGVEYYQVTVQYDYDDTPIIIDTYFRKKDKDLITIQFMVVANSINNERVKNNFKPCN